MVLDQAVRLHDIGPDLTPKRNIELALVQFVGVRLPLLDFQIVEARAKHLHRYLAILALAALCLAPNDDVGWDVSDADSGLHLVDVLPALATGTERVNAKILGPDVDLDAVVDFRNYEDRRERSVAPRRLIKRRDSNETVNPGLSREKAVSIFAGKLHRGRFEASFFSRSLIEDRGGHSTALRPSQVHAKQDGGPILRFGAARAGLNGHDGVEVIVLSGEKCLGFQFGDVAIRGVELAVQLFQQIVLLFDVGLFLSEMDIRLDVSGDRRELLIRGNLLFGTLPFAENALSSFLIVPETGVGDARFKNFQALAVLGRVKDSSARAWCAV